MTPPSESSSGYIDVFRIRQEPSELGDHSLPAACVPPRYRPQGYHSIQLALITGLFACGGLICSMLLVDGTDDFQRLHYWPRKSYSSPALATPKKPLIEPAVPQSETFKSNGDQKNAGLHEHRVG